MSEQPEQISLTIDGKQVTVPNGTTVLQACEKAQSPVPFYCYHPGLTIAGNCRICLVEIEGSPKLEIACYIQATDGMKVQTTSDKTLEGRKDVLEFLLINHPLDCPVCDQAGECWLQDYYMEHGLYDQKFDEQKLKKPKAVPIGPTVVLDAERCILCSRCVRFTDEISKTGEFGIFNRGDHSEIGLHPGKELNNKYSGNVVDICPVGALTDRDFRFKCRVWYLGAAKSVCTGCSRGCNIEIHYNREREWRQHKAKGARVMRLKPRYNPDVNQWWMCDEGRYGYKFIDENRIEQVQIRENGTLRQATWEEGLSRVVSTMKSLRDAKKPDRIGVIVTSYMTNENLYAAKTFFNKLGVTDIIFQRPPSGYSDDLLIQADKSPNAKGAATLGITEGAEKLLERAVRKELSLLYIFGQDLIESFGNDRVHAALNEVEMVVFQGANHTKTSALAQVVFPAAVFAEQEGTFTNFEGRVQRFFAGLDPWAESKPDWKILTELASELKLDVKFVDSPSIFKAIGIQEKAFSGLTYDSLGEHGVIIKA